MAGFPHPANAHNKTAEAITPNQSLHERRDIRIPLLALT